MIDLHRHILPKLDDGALDLEDSVAMARQAHDDGIAVVCGHIAATRRCGVDESPLPAELLQ